MAAQKLLCRVERVVDHGGRVYTVALRPEHRAPRFRAGQFLHLALDPYDATRFWPESRVFSIASAPAQRDLLRISYSVRGAFTARMEAEVTEGRELWIKMPYGSFVVDPRSDAVLFAGGTGITAFTAFIEGLASPAIGPADAGRHQTAGKHVVLAYGARSSDLFIYRDVVDGSARSTAALDVTYFVEHVKPTDAIGGNPPALHPGRVSVDALWPRVRDPQDADYYISGPPAMLQTIARDLRARGVAADRIHIDAWE